MRPEGHEENNEEQDELFDDVPENFLLCALHQGVNFFPRRSLVLNYPI